MDAAESLRKLTVGRIAYCVVAAIPLAIFFSLLFDPGQTKAERFSDFVLSWLQTFLNVPIVLVGVGILIRQRIRKNSTLFWLVAIVIASSPILIEIGLALLEVIADVHVRPFT